MLLSMEKSTHYGELYINNELAILNNMTKLIIFLNNKIAFKYNSDITELDKDDNAKILITENKILYYDDFDMSVIKYFGFAEVQEDYELCLELPIFMQLCSKCTPVKKCLLYDSVNDIIFLEKNIDTIEFICINNIKLEHFYGLLYNIKYLDISNCILTNEFIIYLCELKNLVWISLKVDGINQCAISIGSYYMSIKFQHQASSLWLRKTHYLSLDFKEIHEDDIIRERNTDVSNHGLKGNCHYFASVDMFVPTHLRLINTSKDIPLRTIMAHYERNVGGPTKNNRINFLIVDNTNIDKDELQDTFECYPDLKCIGYEHNDDDDDSTIELHTRYNIKTIKKYFGKDDTLMRNHLDKAVIMM
jgi:hypothetical protein